MRSGEAWKLKWTDLDFKKRAVRVTPEKNGEPRELPISDTMIAMLNLLPKMFQRVFGDGVLANFSRNFRKQRLRISHKLQNSRILKITFHSLRHWKASMEYHQTKDIMHVKRLLGHRNINNTMLYTHLVSFERDDHFTCRVANTVEEATSLIEAGFDYVCQIDQAKLFRKRK